MVLTFVFVLMTLLAPLSRSVSCEKKSACHASRRADADEPAARLPTGHLISQRREDTPTGRCPRMPDGHGAAVDVDLLPVHGIGRRSLPAPLPGGHVGQHLSRKRLVDFDGIDIGQ